MSNEQNNQDDQTKEYKKLNESLEEHGDTRIFEPVTGRHPMQHTIHDGTLMNEREATKTTIETPEVEVDQTETRAAVSAKKPLPPWLKTTLRVLRIFLVPILCIVALYIGLYVGYVVLGHESPGEIWKFSTWKHIFDLVFAEGSPPSSSTP